MENVNKQMITAKLGTIQDIVQVAMMDINLTKESVFLANLTQQHSTLFAKNLTMAFVQNVLIERFSIIMEFVNKLIETVIHLTNQMVFVILVMMDLS